MKKIKEIKDELLKVEEYESTNKKYKLIITQCQNLVVKKIERTQNNPLYPEISVIKDETLINIEPVSITLNQIERYHEIIEEAKTASIEIQKFIANDLCK